MSPVGKMGRYLELGVANLHFVCNLEFQNASVVCRILAVPCVGAYQFQSYFLLVLKAVTLISQTDCSTLRWLVWQYELKYGP